MGIPMEAHPESLEKLRRGTANHPGTRYAAYENQDLGHRELGHLKFLAIGEHWTFQEPPIRLPDTPTEINWRYIFVGFVDLGTGKVIEKGGDR